MTYRTRRIDDIDADLSYSCASGRDARRQLAEVRRRQDELAEVEAALVVALEARGDLVDRLLDERLRAVATAQQVLGPARPVPPSPLVGIIR